MNKEFLKKILIIFLCLILIFNLSYTVFAAGVQGEDDIIGEEEEEEEEPEDNSPSDNPQPETPPTYTISGSIWEENEDSIVYNENGTIKGDSQFQSGEILISGVDVKLCDSNGSILQNKTSDDNGYYSFDNLPSGNYKMLFTYNTENYNGLTHKSAFGPNDIEAELNPIDSQERRLELIQSSSDINYGTLSNQEIDASMTAVRQVEVTNSDVECNFSLIRRPDYSVKITKNISHLTIILSDGTTLIDWDRVNNPNPKYVMYLPDNSLTVIMDDEITHGATIKIKYEIKIENTSEFDSLLNYFEISFIQTFSSILNNVLFNHIPTTYYLYDYLDKNLIFDENDNFDNWTILNNNNLFPSSNNMDLSSFNVLVNNVTLTPGESQTLTLNASKIMTIADTDLLTYNNYIEVIAYRTFLGTILTYDDELNNRHILTPGNLNIYDETREYEPDEAKAETVTRVPPFGKNLSYYTTIVGIIILAIEIVVLSTLKYKIKRLKNRYIRRK